MANSAIEDYQTMIQGLTKYMQSLQENCQTLKQAGQVYDQGINDSSSKVYRAKIEKLCAQIDPPAIERVEKLRQNLQQQMEQLIEMQRQLAQEMNE